MTNATDSAILAPPPNRTAVVELLESSSATAALTDLEPPLLASAEIEFELRRLIARLIEGSRLLHLVRTRKGGSQSRNRMIESRGGVLLDLEVDGVRCLLTRRLTAGHAAVGRLTIREREVANMVATGLTNSAIAGILEVSPWTVSTHLRRIFAKLDVPTRAAMVAVIADARGPAGDPATAPSAPHRETANAGPGFGS